MRILKLDEASKKNILNDLLKRSPNNYDEYADTVAAIVNNVRANGDKAVFDYTYKFDKTVLTKENILVTKKEIEEAYSQVEPSLVEVIKKLLKIFVFSTKNKDSIAGLTQSLTAQFLVRR